jgi:NYN domain
MTSGSGRGAAAEGVVRVRSALFVDLENIFIGLGRLDPDAAQRFATDPIRWLTWLETLTYQRLGAPGPVRRDILMRACYLNPVASGRHRAYFTRAGFNVIDCPPLTSAGKNSADIHIVIDILDLLTHPTHFDEVILLSADADYTPVMLRLRAHDRRTVIITSGPSAPAFRAACDHVVDEDTFIDLALSDPAPPDPDDRELDQVGPAVAPATAADTDQKLRAAIAKVVRDVVAVADRPVNLATAAHQVRAALGAGRVEGWAGTGSFKKVLATTDLAGLVLSSAHPGWVYDPARHDAPEPTPAAAAGPDGLTELRTRIARVTDIPALTTANYQILFSELAAELAENGYHHPTTARAVHDRVTARGATIGRPTVIFVLSSLTSAGHPPRPGDTAATLAAAYTDNVLSMCQNARMELSDDEIALVRAWLLPAS